MSQCMRRILPRCFKCLNRYESSRNSSDVRFVKSNSSQSLLDLKEVHMDWKSAGHFPKAPAHVVKHGAKCLQTLVSHSRLNDHLFNGQQYRLFPLHARYGDVDVDFGNLLSPSQTAQPPQVEWSSLPVDADKKYTLILYSPDCSSCKLHWWTSNISPSDVTNNPDDVTTVLPYVPAVPLKGTGVYRYVLVLLEQNSVLSEILQIERLTELNDLIREQQLAPVGMAFYQAFWDETVGPNLAKHLGLDEKQFCAERPKDMHEFYAEERFLRKEWEMKTGFM